MAAKRATKAKPEPPALPRAKPKRLYTNLEFALVKAANIAGDIRVLLPFATLGMAQLATKSGAAVICQTDHYLSHVEALGTHPVAHVLHQPFVTVDPEPTFERVVFDCPDGHEVEIINHARKFLKTGGLLVVGVAAEASIPALPQFSGPVVGRIGNRVFVGYRR